MTDFKILDLFLSVAVFLAALALIRLVGKYHAKSFRRAAEQSQQLLDQDAEARRDAPQHILRQPAFLLGLAVCLVAVGAVLYFGRLGSSGVTRASLDAGPVEFPAHFRQTDIDEALERYRKGSTREREIVLAGLRRIMERTHAAKDWDCVNETKLTMLQIISTEHPEIADVNFAVKELVDTLLIDGPTRASYRQIYSLRAMREWRSKPEERIFQTKISLGTVPESEPEQHDRISVSCREALDSVFQPLPEDNWSVQLFNTRCPKATEVVLRIDVPLELLEQGEGKAVLRIAIDDIETKVPLSIYTFEPQRFYRGVDHMTVVVHSCQAKVDSLLSSELVGRLFPYNDSALRFDVEQVFNDEREAWDYKFEISEPGEPIVFIFRKST